MSLIVCRECGNKLSSKARFCPSCGAPSKGRGGCRRGCGMVVLILISVIVITIVGVKLVSPQSVSPIVISEDHARLKPEQVITEESQPIESVLIYAPSETNWDEYLTEWKSELCSSKCLQPEPDWNAHLTYWKNHLESTIVIPEVGDRVELVLQNGVVKEGKFLGLTNELVTIDINGQRSSFDRKDLRIDSRRYFWEGDNVSARAIEKVKKEKVIYDDYRRNLESDVMVPDDVGIKYEVLRSWKPDKVANGFGADILIQDEPTADELVQFVEELSGSHDPVFIRIWTSRKAWQDTDATTPEFRTDYLLCYVKNYTGKGAFRGFNEIRWMQEDGKYSDRCGTKTTF